MEREGEFAYFLSDPEYDSKDLVWPKDPNPEGVKKRLEECFTLADGVKSDSWSGDALKAEIWPYAEREGKGGVLWPLRYALSGRERSPDPFILADILGKDETVRRITSAIEKLG